MVSNRIKKKIKSWMIKNRVKKYSFIKNVSWSSSPRKRVLFSYLTDVLNEDVSNFRFNTNRQECLIFFSMLINNGFIVDFYHCEDESFDETIEYDLVLGFGFPYRKAKLTKNGIRVLYCTEAHPDFSFEEEKKRVDAFFQREKKKISIERTFSYYISEDYDMADKFIVYGNENVSYLESLKVKKENIYKHCPTGISPPEDFILEESKGKDFVWLGSRGIVHKGLDIAIRSFLISNIDSRLHICGVNKKELSKYLKVDDERVLIHGRVNVVDDYFKNILKTSCFLLMPSCSEGMSTSVLTGMRFGLIPLVTKACNVPCPDELLIRDIDLISFKNKLEEVHEIESEKINAYAIGFYKETNEKYCLDSFEKRTEQIVNELKSSL